MGPPNFTYTSQLGSAFVQNQFVPYLAQQPLLPQSQQPTQQHLLPSNQLHNQNQRHNQHNKGMGGGRYNQGDKNDRQNNRRNNNRNDNKFDRPRSGDRDFIQQNNRSSKSGREKSNGRVNRREDIPIRPSPTPQSSARSTTSVTSDKGSKSRRHYDVQNIPKTKIMTNMNAYNMKQRCPSSVHVPSDLKDIIVNSFFRLDIKNIPKPITFEISQTDAAVNSEAIIEDANTETVKISKEDNESEKDIPPNVKKDQDGGDVEPKVNEVTITALKSDLKMHHKYGVKVILISLPELDALYKGLFSSDSNSDSHKKLDEMILLLCNKGSNNGHSLIGGKFDPVSDGFVEGETNQFERHRRQPDLIATCKRVVLEQTGLDLKECQTWSHLSTFIYNNKSDYFSANASVEYSFIYMPHIWDQMINKFDETVLTSNTENVEMNEKGGDPVPGETSPNPTEPEASSVEASSVTVAEEASKDESDEPSSSVKMGDTPSLEINNLMQLKVTDLKAELDSRGITYKGLSKKADLVDLLRANLKRLKDAEDSQNDHESKPADSSEVELQGSSTETVETGTAETQLGPSDETQECNSAGQESTVKEESILEEGEVETEASNDMPTPTDGANETQDPETTGKRKDPEGDDDLPMSKRVCASPTAQKEQRVKLIREPFKVNARSDQQQLSLVSLNESAQASRHDQFELSVASNILKESLTQHLSEYIFTTLVEDNQSKLGNHEASNSSSQETNSDTNNNSTKAVSKNQATTVEPIKTGAKELPTDRYINLAFAYFDSTHMGHVYFDDLNKLFNNTGLTVSKRALLSLVGDCDKFNYRTLPDMPTKLSPNHVYRFPGQFLHSKVSPSNSGSITGAKMIEHEGVTYDVEKMIQQVRDAETMRVSLVDRFNHAIENSDKQLEEIHILEVSQKSLSKAIKSQNDEICDLKRERDSIKKKVSFSRIARGRALIA